MKRVFSLIIGISLLICMFAPQGSAAGATLSFTFTTDETGLPRESAFTVDVTVMPGGREVSALRLYILYNKACFTWDPAATQRFGIVSVGMFAQRNAVNEAAKYPAGMPEAERAEYDIIVLEWAAKPQGGGLPAIPAGPAVQALSLGFQVKADAPYAKPGGNIFISADYSYADTPYFYAESTAADVTYASLTIQPMPPAPSLSTALTISGGYIYGFPTEMPQVGTVQPWKDEDLSQFFTVTNDGVLRLTHVTGYPVTGTGTTLELWNVNETQQYGEYMFIVFGDVDGNFVIDYDDWALLRTLPLGAVGVDPIRFAADVNANGEVDADDLQAVFDAAAGTAAITQTR